MSCTKERRPRLGRIFHILPNFGVEIRIVFGIQPSSELFPAIFAYKQILSVGDPLRRLPPPAGRWRIVGDLFRCDSYRDAPNLCAIPARFRIEVKGVTTKPIAVKEIEPTMCN